MTTLPPQRSHARSSRTRSPVVGLCESCKPWFTDYRNCARRPVSRCKRRGAETSRSARPARSGPTGRRVTRLGCLQAGPETEFRRLYAPPLPPVKQTSPAAARLGSAAEQLSPTGASRYPPQDLAGKPPAAGVHSHSAGTLAIQFTDTAEPVTSLLSSGAA